MMTSQVQMSVAMMQMAGDAVANQIKIMQAISLSAMEMPYRQFKLMTDLAGAPFGTIRPGQTAPTPAPAAKAAPKPAAKKPAPKKATAPKATAAKTGDQGGRPQARTYNQGCGTRQHGRESSGHQACDSDNFGQDRSPGGRNASPCRQARADAQASQDSGKIDICIGWGQDHHDPHPQARAQGG